jgi:hypothetical protein
VVEKSHQNPASAPPQAGQPERYEVCAMELLDHIGEALRTDYRRRRRQKDGRQGLSRDGASQPGAAHRVHRHRPHPQAGRCRDRRLRRGGGLELALCADFCICGERTKLGQPEIVLGIIPVAGGTQRLPRLIGPARAKNLVYTGRFVAAAEALRIGLVDEVVPDADVYDAATRLAAQFVGGPAQALRAAKQAIDEGLGLDLDAGLEVEGLHSSALFAPRTRNSAWTASAEQSGPGKARFARR